MIKTYSMLVKEYSHYKASEDKLLRMIHKGVYKKLTRGLYETDSSTPGYLLANAIYGPSYLSFEFALSYHGLIPEGVYTYTSATFRKRKEKKYTNFFGTFTYRDIPADAFPYDVLLIKENNYYYKIATAEKALCDKLYMMKPLKNKKEMISLLFNDLRIDETKFGELDKHVLTQLCDLYRSTNLKLLKKVIR